MGLDRIPRINTQARARCKSEPPILKIRRTRSGPTLNAAADTCPWHICENKPNIFGTSHNNHNVYGRTQQVIVVVVCEFLHPATNRENNHLRQSEKTPTNKYRTQQCFHCFPVRAYMLSSSIMRPICSPTPANIRVRIEDPTIPRRRRRRRRYRLLFARARAHFVQKPLRSHRTNDFDRTLHILDKRTKMYFSS